MQITLTKRSWWIASSRQGSMIASEIGDRLENIEDWRWKCCRLTLLVGNQQTDAGARDPMHIVCKCHTFLPLCNTPAAREWDASLVETHHLVARGGSLTVVSYGSWEARKLGRWRRYTPGSCSLSGLRYSMFREFIVVSLFSWLVYTKEQYLNIVLVTDNIVNDGLLGVHCHRLWRGAPLMFFHDSNLLLFYSPMSQAKSRALVCQ